MEHPAVALGGGVRMPMLGLSVFRCPPGENTRSVVRTAIELGYRHIDTARVYCNEKSTGRGIRDSGIDRSEMFITTKLWRSDFARPRQGLMQSLERLGTDYVDLFLLHWPFAGYEQAWAEMVELQRAGLCRAIGVCNFRTHHLEQLRRSGAEVMPQLNQTECHPECSEEEHLRYLRRCGMVMAARSPLGGEGHTLVHDPRLMAIARYYRVSTAQVILRWNVQRGVSVIPKSVHPERIRDNADIFGFELSDIDMESISSLDRGARRGWDPDLADRQAVLHAVPLTEEP